MTALLTNVSAVFTTCIGFVGTIASTVTAEGNEVLLIPVGITIAGLAVGFFKRLANSL